MKALRTFVVVIPILFCLAGCAGDSTANDPLCTPACGSNAACVSVIGTPTCVCVPGYMGDGHICLLMSDGSPDAEVILNDSGVDSGVDSGASCSPACGSNASCVAVLGSGPTCWCNPGYAGDGFACADLDECTLGLDSCDTAATCTNMPGSYGCSCPTGYTGDGQTCTNVDECAAAANPCGPHAICTDTPGSFACACDVGYIEGVFSCVPNIDECALGTDDCDVHATCIDTPDSFSCVCNAGYGGDGKTCTFGWCGPAPDTDTGTQTITITHLSIPAVDGLDLDGINNASPPAGMGATIAGCGKSDNVGGIDNALGAVATGLTGTLDLNAAMAGLVQRTLPDGGTQGSLVLTIVADHLSTTANDPCLGLSATFAPAGRAPVTIIGFGTMTNNVVNATFVGALPFYIPMDGAIPNEVCISGVCSSANLSLMVRGLRATMTLSASHTIITSGIIGGHVFYQDAAAGYEQANMTGFVQSFTDFAIAANLDGSNLTPPTGTTALGLNVFLGARDLHMAVDGSLTPCTGSSTTATDKNAFSVGFAIDSL